jgi:hypothetical protein
MAIINWLHLPLARAQIYSILLKNGFGASLAVSVDMFKKTFTSFRVNVSFLSREAKLIEQCYTAGSKKGLWLVKWENNSV